MERPAAAVARPTAITTNRHAATNNSALCVRATLRNNGRNTKRPKAAIAVTVSRAWPTARPNAAMLLTWVAGAKIPRTSSNGTTARSWNNRIAKLVGDGVEPLLLGQHLNHHCRRRHCQGQADDAGADSVMPEKDHNSS